MHATEDHAQGYAQDGPAPGTAKQQSQEAERKPAGSEPPQGDSSKDFQADTWRPKR